MKELSKKLWLKRGWIGGLCLLVACMAASWWVLTPKEPSYQGKTLTEWQDEVIEEYRRISYTSRETVTKSEHAAVVAKYKQPFASMGTNAIPFLLWQLQKKDSRVVTAVEQFMVKLKITQEDPLEGMRNLVRVRYTFEILGEKANAAIPELIRLAKIDNDLRPACIDILSVREVESADFLDLLVEVVRGPDDEYHSKDSAYYAIESLGKKARSIAPKLKAIEAKAKAKGDKQQAEYVADLLGLIGDQDRRDNFPLDSGRIR